MLRKHRQSIPGLALEVKTAINVDYPKGPSCPQLCHAGLAAVRQRRNQSWTRFCDKLTETLQVQRCEHHLCCMPMKEVRWNRCMQAAFDQLPAESQERWCLHALGTGMLGNLQARLQRRMTCEQSMRLPFSRSSVKARQQSQSFALSYEKPPAGCRAALVCFRCPRGPYAKGLPPLCPATCVGIDL